jgi:hypothetical protein
MRNFFDRLAGRALGVAPMAQPLIPPVTALESGSAPVEAFAEVSKEHVRPSATAAEPDVSGKLHESLPPRESEPSALDEARISGLRVAENGGSVEEPVPAAIRPAEAAPLIPAAPPVPAAPQYERTTSKVQPDAESTGARTIRTEPRISPQYSVVGQVVPRVTAHPTPLSANQLSASLARRSASGGPAEAPVIRVTIGRVDVRAQFSQSAPPTPSRESRKPSVLSLEQYAKQRSEGRR